MRGQRTTYRYKFTSTSSDNKFTVDLCATGPFSLLNGVPGNQWLTHSCLCRTIPLCPHTQHIPFQPAILSR